MKIVIRNPATGEELEEYELLDFEQAKEIVRKAHEAQREWAKLSIEERCSMLRKLAEELRNSKEELAKQAALEMGKPIKQGRGEVEKCAFIVEYFCDHAKEFLSPEPVSDIEAEKCYIDFEPIGVILAIMPWNFPYSQVIRCAVPTLLLGNTVVLKHSTLVPGCAVKLTELFNEVLPEHVFNNVLCKGSVASQLISLPEVAGVAFTGSVETGRIIAKLAGENLKRCVLELGGSDPFVVLEDAPLEPTVEACVKSRFKNTGEACNAAKRIIVHEAVYGEFLSRFIEKVSQLKVGDPLDEATEIGPMASEEQLAKIERQVEESVKLGAKVEVGGKRIGERGYFYEPTVLTSITFEMPVWKEEVFGPVAPVIKAKDENEAIRLANATNFGLGGSVWTADLERGERIANQIEAGMVFVNKVVSSDPRIPFGGVKNSGIGRELSRYGILEFANVKPILVKSL